MKLLACVAGAIVAAGCSPEEAPAPAPAAIGERCLGCHEGIVRSYRETGMGRAVEPLRKGELEGLAPVADAAGWTYRFDSERIVESWKDGSTAVEAPIAFAIGAGLMDRSYAASVGDLIAFAPLEVVTDGSKRHAALAPPHAMRPGMRFSTPITEECLACHTDRLPPRDYPLALRPDPATWSPAGISCAACHGDVEGHADWREGLGDAEKDPILPAKGLGREESLSICARCHLQGDASLLLEPLARGVLPPGGDMLDRRAVFVAAEPSEEIRFVGHVERLMRSPCFAGSSMTCVTCHDPHRSSFDPAGRRAVRDACSTCHSDGGHPCTKPIAERAGRDCVDCHMRRTGVFDVAEVLIHDHFIRRDPGPPSPPAPLRLHESKDGKLALFAWPGEARPAYADDAGLWMMAEMAAGHPELALPFADREPGHASALLPTYHHLRGSLLEGAGRFAEARKAYGRALALDPASAETSVNLALLESPREGLAMLDAVIAAHPKAHTALRNRAVLRLRLGDAPGFAADLRAAYAILPDAAVASALADWSRKSGDAAESLHWTREALRIDPARR